MYRGIRVQLSYPNIAAICMNLVVYAAVDCVCRVYTNFLSVLIFSLTSPNILLIQARKFPQLVNISLVVSDYLLQDLLQYSRTWVSNQSYACPRKQINTKITLFASVLRLFLFISIYISIYIINPRNLDRLLSKGSVLGIFGPGISYTISIAWIQASACSYPFWSLVIVILLRLLQLLSCVISVVTCCSNTVTRGSGLLSESGSGSLVYVLGSIGFVCSGRGLLLLLDKDILILIDLSNILLSQGVNIIIT